MARTGKLGKPTLAGVLVGLGGFALSLVAMTAGAATSWTVAGAHAGAALVTLAVLSRLKARPSIAAACAAGLVGTAPLAMLAAALTVTEPFVVSHWRCGTGLVGLIILAPFFYAGASAVGAVVGWLVVQVRHATIARAFLAVTRLSAGGAIVLAAFLVAGALARSSSPTPDEWVETIPTIGELPIPAFECTGTTCEPSKETFEIGGYAFERRCSTSGSCELRLADARDDTAWVETGAHGAVRVAEREGLVFVGENAAFDLRDGGRVTDVAATRVASSVAPPRAWQWLGIAGLALALMAALGGLRERRTRQRLAAARAGLVEDGFVVFEDAVHPSRARALEAIPDGPALALPTGLAASPTYRDAGDGPPWRVVPGRREDILAQSRASELASFLVAAACAVSSAAPLFVAWLNGLAF